MTNKEKYKQAFSGLQISEELSWEGLKMKKKKSYVQKKLWIASAVLVFAVGSMTAAYAADVGGIQRTVQLWIHGDQTRATLTFDGEGSYQMSYTDEEGNIKEQGGGGVAVDVFGKERPLTEEELMESINAPEVIYEDDGSVWVYWFDQKVDITDKFENEICYVKLVRKDQTLYMTVRYQDGYATSLDKYIDPQTLGSR